MTIEQLLFEAHQKRDEKEVKRLNRLIERLDDIRATYGKIQRGQLIFKNGDGIKVDNIEKNTCDNFLNLK